MSNFLIIPKERIAQDNWDKAYEIFEIWGARKDSDWDDLVSMVAEGLQTSYYKGKYGNDTVIDLAPTEGDEEEDIEVVVTALKPKGK